MTGGAKIVCIACSIFRNEMETLRSFGQINYPVIYLTSMLHMRPDILQETLADRIRQERAKGKSVLLLYGDCHPRLREQTSAPCVARVEGINCPEILLGRDRYRALRREGVFFLLREWTLHWKEVFKKELGLEGKLARQFMQEMHTRLVYVDSGNGPIPQEQIEEISDYSGLAWEKVEIGLEPLRTALGRAVDRVLNNET